MKKLKKLLSIMLVLCFVLTMIPTMNVQAATKTTVAKKTLYNKNGIKISSMSLTETSTDYTLKLAVKNSTASNYRIYLDGIGINGVQMLLNGYIYTTVPSKKNGVLKFYIQKDTLDTYTIKTISYFSFVFGVNDEDSYERVATSTVINLPTNKYSKSNVYKPSGKKILSDKYVDCYYNGYSEEYGYCILIKNKTNKIAITLDNFSVNDWGYDLESYDGDAYYNLYDEVVLKNNYCAFAIPVTTDFMSDCEITKIKNIEFSLYFSDKKFDTVKISL